MLPVSVIVPVYKVEAYLNRCVDSILAQTYSDFELILVDDGSPDNCGKICDEYAEKDSRVTVIHQENGGLSAARNAGLNVATGKYVYFCDSDDYLNISTFERLSPFFDNDYDLISFGYIKFWDNGKIAVFSPKEAVYRFITSEEKYKFIVDILLNYKIGWEAWVSFRKREIIDNCRLSFADTRIVFAEDMLFSICYCTNISSVAIVPDQFYHYYQRANSIMDNSKQILLYNKMNTLSKHCFSTVSAYEDNTVFRHFYPSIHYLIINNSLQKEKNKGKTIIDIRHELRKDIEDWDFFSYHLNRYIKCNTIEVSKKYELLYLLSGKIIYLLRIKLRRLLSKIKRFFVKTRDVLNR